MRNMRIFISISQGKEVAYISPTVSELSTGQDMRTAHKMQIHFLRVGVNKSGNRKNADTARSRSARVVVPASTAQYWPTTAHDVLDCLASALLCYSTL
jgi:hypothetical protein